MLRLLILLAALLPGALLAQSSDDPAVLVADQLFITRDRTLVAQGNVEAFQGEVRLRAQAIRYNQSGGLTIEGPIVLQEGADTVILADAGQLDADLRNGLLVGARLILNQQLQLAATQIDRVDGRYSQLYQTAVTSCRICETGDPPLWQIRAKRVIHDQEAQQLYFDRAQFLIRNVPVFYLPRLRLPDPTLDRASGFLIPSVRTTSQLGTGLKVPYFIKLGDHRDLTLTPYLSSRTRTIEYRYRQAFVRGRVEFNGAFSRDEIRPGKTRAYLFGNGQFDLNRDYKLTFNIEASGDRAYLRDYSFSDKDRLRSDLTVSRARRDEFIGASLINFETLRDGEINDNQPTVVLNGTWQKRIFPSELGGELRFTLDAHNHRRGSDSAVDADGDGVADGRDVARLGARVEYLRRVVFNSGLVSDVTLGAAFDSFDVTQDNDFPQNTFDAVAFGAVALRYPMIRRGPGGVVQTLEPVIQVGFTGGERLDLPNDESTRVEFDEGNLLALSRFPAPDRRERGSVVAVGLNWSRIDPNGWDATLTLGQVIRDEFDPAFSETSGLRGNSSDILLAGQIRTQGGMAVSGRSLFDDNLNFAKAELRGDWQFARGRLGGSYIWLDADDAEERPQDISEITLDGALQLNRHWTASADWRYDTADDRAATAGVGLTYNNECVSVDLSVNRRYSSSTSIEPSTNIGFNVGLRGFSALNGPQDHTRTCRK